MPEVPSVPANKTVSGWLYQPFASGCRSAVELSAGGVLSILRSLVSTWVRPPAFSAQHVTVTPRVSSLSVRALQSGDEARSGVLGSVSISQLIVRLLLY